MVLFFIQINFKIYLLFYKYLTFFHFFIIFYLLFKNRFRRFFRSKREKSSTSQPFSTLEACCSTALCCPVCLFQNSTTSLPEIRMKLKNSPNSTSISKEAPSTSRSGGGGGGQSKHHHHQHSHRMAQSSGNSERTTRMLIAVLIMFLICEFPSGILALLSGILGMQCINLFLATVFCLL